MPEEKNHFVALHVQRRIIQSLLHDISTYTRPRVVNSTIVRPMFTVKHANDEGEFYADMERIERRQILEKDSYPKTELETMEKEINRALNRFYSGLLDRL